MLDMNKDGTVNEKEFVDGVTDFRIRGLDAAKLIQVFKALDQDKSDSLSLGEIWYFIEGSQPTA